MIKKILFCTFSPLLITLVGCSAKTNLDKNPEIISLQLIDRNGFSETISSKERLESYQKIDFQQSQPFEKVLRVFERDFEGKSHSKLTAYHPNGQIQKSLDIVEGRAHGKYNEWFPSGKPHIEVDVIEGTPELDSSSQATWVFHGMSKVWNEEGELIAKIPYEKGVLEGTSEYFYPNKKIKKQIPYKNDQIHGSLLFFSEEGELLEKEEFISGKQHGTSFKSWNENTPCSLEEYQKGNLIQGSYFTKEGKKIGGIAKGKGIKCIFGKNHLEKTVEYHEGVAEGEVKLFASDGTLLSSYQMQNGAKNGMEWEYFSYSEQPKLSLFWRNNTILEGKTWYKNGIMESQKEFFNNQKHGTHVSWFSDGSLMLMEEYENDLLLKGSYFKKGIKKPISKVEEGSGIATIFDSEGHLLQKIPYEKGNPIDTKSL